MSKGHRRWLLLVLLYPLMITAQQLMESDPLSATPLQKAYREEESFETPGTYTEEGIVFEKEPDLPIEEREKEITIPTTDLGIAAKMIQKSSDELKLREEKKIIPPEMTTAAEFAKTKRVIRNIEIKGNKSVSPEAILHKIPFKKGDFFDPIQTNPLIHNLYVLGYFKNISVATKQIDDEQLDLIITLEEKKRLKEVIIEGNNKITLKEIYKKIPFDDIPSIDEAEMKKYAAMIKAIYIAKDFHLAEVSYELKKAADDSVIAIFKIVENQKVIVRRVNFKGNHFVSDKKLRTLIFTREAWPFSIIDKSGSYQPDAIEWDRYTLEDFYQNNGFLSAKIVAADINFDKKNYIIDVTFAIDEGDQYYIKEVEASGNNIIPDEDLVARSGIRPGQLYSRAQIRRGLEAIRFAWGEQGYLYADVEPSIEPDEKTKTIKVSFITVLGKKVYLNRVNIKGNKKTRDKIIRRQILLEEGDLLSIDKLEASKMRVELLSYFDPRAGVEYGIKRVDEDHADIDFILKEVRTGSFQLRFGLGGSIEDITSPAKSFTAGLNITDPNLFGRGIQYNFNAEAGKERRDFNFYIANPWLFNRPINGSFGASFKSSTYDELKHIKNTPVETLYGFALGLGYVSRLLRNIQLLGEVGYDSIHYTKNLDAYVSGNNPAQVAYQQILESRFESGELFWINAALGKDKRNHTMHTSRGYRWTLTSRFGVPATNFGFFKLEGDASWYTPLIGENDLVLTIHGHFGLIVSLDNKNIPYRELFHIGGPTSVRGFLFGQIGPNFLGDSLGGKKTMYLNIELCFPIKKDFSMKGVVFYDGGSGWDTPNAQSINPLFLESNNFDYRHSFGIGIRMLQPTPLQVDWGFKLDRNKGEKLYEIHLTAYHEF